MIISAGLKMKRGISLLYHEIGLIDSPFLFSLMHAIHQLAVP